LATQRSIPLKIESGIDINVPFEVQIVELTPQRAQEWLTSHNKNNRSLSKTQVEKYKLQMDEGNWDVLNGEFLKFDEKGNLCDGQNRLAAIAQRQDPQVVAIIRGIPSKSRFTIDQGRSRSDAHLLQIRGVKDGTQRAMVARVCAQFDVWQTNNGINNWGWTTRFIPTGVAADNAVNDPEVVKAYEFAMANRRRLMPLGLGTVGALHYALHKYGTPEYAEEFLTALRDDTAPEGSPIYALRRRFEASLDPSLPQSRFRSRDEMLSITVHAYNSWRDGKVWERARRPKQFPRIISE
jgi:hypothetical protein